MTLDEIDAIGRDVIAILDAAHLRPMRLSDPDGRYSASPNHNTPGSIARQIARVFTLHCVGLWPRVHVATQLQRDLRTLRVAFIKVRTGATISGEIADVLAVAQPEPPQSSIDRILDEQVGAVVFRWCSCGAGAQPAGGHEQDCPLVPFDVMPGPTAPATSRSSTTR